MVVFVGFLMTTLKNADVSKNLVASYGFFGWHFFQEVLAHTHAKYLGKWPSGTVIFRVGVNLPPPPSRMIESEHPFTNRVNRYNRSIKFCNTVISLYIN